MWLNIYDICIFLWLTLYLNNISTFIGIIFEAEIKIGSVYQVLYRDTETRFRNFRAGSHIALEA